MTIPYRPVILSDSQYAILDDMRNYKDFSDDTGMDMDHMRQALKALAKLHAMSYAYFSLGQSDVKAFSETLKMIVDRHYQPAASADDKAAKRAELAANFDATLDVLRALNAEGARVADAAERRFKRQLFDLYKEANSTTSSFSVLCHGNPVPANIKFLYNAEGTPVDVKFVSFTRAIYAHAVVDLQILLATAMGPKVEEQIEFLLRFVYHETLAATMASLGVDRSNVPDYDALRKEYKKKSVFGCLAGAMYLAAGPTAGAAGNKAGSGNRDPRGGNRVFESKIMGRFGSGKMGKVAVAVHEAANPKLRALTLVQRALELEADVKQF